MRQDRIDEPNPLRVCYVANTAWNLTHFRLNQMKAARDLGLQVHAVAPEDDYVKVLEREGIRYHHWAIKRRSLNPANEILSLRRLAAIYRAIRPDLVHHFTVKAVLYGTAAARISGVGAIVNSVTGLPYIVVSPKKSWSGKLARWTAMQWYGWSLSGRRVHTILQNEDDRAELRRFSRLSLESSTLTRGSGVDLAHFSFHPPPSNAVPVIVFVGRLLREKGIFELIDAVRILRAEGLSFQLILCGDVDGGNRSSATSRDCAQWIAEGLVKQIRRVDDVRPFLKEADMVVLPSYREGTPRSLLEAMAVGRAIVTTDVPGCREAVVDAVNGFLVPSKDAQSLSQAMRVLLESPEKRRVMGVSGRVKAEQQFDERRVIQANLDVYRSLLPTSRWPDGTRSTGDAVGDSAPHRKPLESLRR